MFGCFQSFRSSAKFDANESPYLARPSIRHHRDTRVAFFCFDKYAFCLSDESKGKKERKQRKQRDKETLKKIIHLQR